jgi:hypothetical protein
MLACGARSATLPGQIGGALFQYGMGQFSSRRFRRGQAINVTPNGTANYFARNGGLLMRSADEIQTEIDDS